LFSGSDRCDSPAGVESGSAPVAGLLAMSVTAEPPDRVVGVQDTMMVRYRLCQRIVTAYATCISRRNTLPRGIREFPPLSLAQIRGYCLLRRRPQVVPSAVLEEVPCAFLSPTVYRTAS